MTKTIEKMTKKEFQQVKNRRPKRNFNGFVIVPMDELHDSGYRCMKFVLTNHSKIVGAVSGWSDVVHINGIMGYGRGLSTEPKWHDFHIDCLPESGLVRLFTLSGNLEIDEFIGSDFIFYEKEK